ncbi:MAG: heavy metal-binding domain-containing protein [Verrucomicrobiota bacterium]
MTALIEIFFQLGIFLLLLGIGYFFGSYRENRHLKSLERREKELSSITRCNLKTVPADWTIASSKLVVGSVVIANDYFKVVVASLRNLFGGRVNSLVKLVERARREAMVRMLSEAKKQGAHIVWNVRIETSTIASVSRSSAGVEVTAYGTALQISNKAEAVDDYKR